MIKKKQKTWPAVWTKYRYSPRKRDFDTLYWEFSKMLHKAQIDETVVYKKWLCIHEDYARDTIYDAYRSMPIDTEEQQENKSTISRIVKKINDVISNRLFQWGVDKKYDSWLVRLYMSSQAGMRESIDHNVEWNITTKIILTGNESLKELEEKRKALLW
jgi:hypothetical protein